MLYDFSTIQPAESEDQALSAESLSYDGKYLEKEVPGFRILTVSGRGILVKEITERTRSGFDGADFVRRIIPPRDITVQYVLSAPTAPEFMSRVNILNGLLSKNQAVVIFADEPDKYFVGTADNATDLEAGRLSCTGEIRIRCSDPYKYAVMENPVSVSVSAARKSPIIIHNAGNAEAFLRFELSGSKPNGYIGISSAYGGMEFGNIEAAGSVHVDDAQEWLLESSDVIKDWPSTAGETQHSLKRIRAAATTGDQKMQDWLALGPANFHASGNWCRRTVEVQVPRDSTQQTQDPRVGGASSFYVSLFHWFETAHAAQCGEQKIMFMNVNGTTEKEIACLTIHKNSVSNQAEYLVWINGNLVRSFPFVCDSRNPFAQGFYGNNDFHKDGERFRYYFNGKYYGHTEPALRDTVCNRIRFSFAHFPDREAVTRNYLGRFRFRKDHISGSAARTVAFPQQSRLTVDGQSGKAYLEGQYRPDLEVRGSQYFKIPPGDSEIRITPSTWFEGALTGTIYVQERWY